MFYCLLVSGAFSDVYKAVDVNTLQKVAVKVVRKYELSPIQVKYCGVKPWLGGLFALLSQLQHISFRIDGG